MRNLAWLLLVGAACLSAQSNAIVGVWKADLGKSKIAGPPGPPPSNYLVMIEEKMATVNQRTKEEAPLVTETTGVWGQRGQQRTIFTVFNNGKPMVRPYSGVPTRLTAGWQGEEFIVDGEVAGRPSTFKRAYKLSPDHNTLTVTIQSTTDGKSSETNLVLLKQPDDAGAPLRQPEELASVHFKNIKVESLKKLPESEFINRMHYISWALDRNCEFCHVPRKFDSDDKKEKETARKMVDMVAAIDSQHFEGTRQLIASLATRVTLIRFVTTNFPTKQQRKRQLSRKPPQRPRKNGAYYKMQHRQDVRSSCRLLRKSNTCCTF